MVPCSVPSLMIALISSSVTETSFLVLILKSLKKILVTKFNNHTMGWVILDKNFIGLATILAILSAWSNPILLGMSSPNTMDRKVTKITTSVIEMVSA